MSLDIHTLVIANLHECVEPEFVKNQLNESKLCNVDKVNVIYFPPNGSFKESFYRVYITIKEWYPEANLHIEKLKQGRPLFYCYEKNKMWEFTLYDRSRKNNPRYFQSKCKEILNTTKWYNKQRSNNNP